MLYSYILFLYNDIFLQLFYDPGNNSAVISLDGCPVISGDVKIRFESSAVSELYLFLASS